MSYFVSVQKCVAALNLNKEPCIYFVKYIISHTSGNEVPHITCYLGKLNGKDLLILEVHEEAVHQQLVVNVPSS